MRLCKYWNFKKHYGMQTKPWYLQNCKKVFQTNLIRFCSAVSLRSMSQFFTVIFVISQAVCNSENFWLERLTLVCKLDSTGIFLQIMKRSSLQKTSKVNLKNLSMRFVAEMPLVHVNIRLGRHWLLTTNTLAYLGKM
jgi:hypothetical protein